MDERGIPRRPYEQRRPGPLAYQMGVKFDIASFDDVTGAFKRGRGTGRTRCPGKIFRRPPAAGYLLSPAEKRHVSRFANRVLKAGRRCLSADRVDGRRTDTPMRPAALYVVANAAVDAHSCRKGAQGARRQPGMRRPDRQAAGATKTLRRRRIAPLGYGPTGSIAVRLDALRARAVSNFRSPSSAAPGFDDTRAALEVRRDSPCPPAGGFPRRRRPEGGRWRPGARRRWADEPVPVPGAGPKQDPDSAQPLPGNDRYRHRRPGAEAAP